jgi:drug/metabolite transporter (DMT)-like permease
MTPISALLIFLTLVSFVAGQLLLKHAMQRDSRRGSFAKFFTGGLIAMTFSFFVTLGLFRQFDLSYLYPFQGLTVIIITLLAAVILREKLTARLLFGAVLISAGVVLVSLS